MPLFGEGEVDPETFALIVRSSPSEVIFWRDDESSNSSSSGGLSPFDRMWSWSTTGGMNDKNSSVVASAPYSTVRETLLYHLLQSECPHRVLQGLLVG